MFRSFTIFIFSLFALVVQAQNVTVEASIDSTAILIGEQLHLHTIVSCPARAKVSFPAFKDGYITEGVEMLEAGRIDTVVLNEGKRWELHRDYLITAFDSAVYTIPRFEVEVNGHKYQSRNEIGLKVNTVEVDLQHPDEFRPLKAPVDALFAWSIHLLLWSLSTWVALLIAVFACGRLSSAKPVTRRICVKPPMPPQQVAMEKIERIKSERQQQAGLPEDEAVQKAYFMALTDILRAYIAERFGINAREMTTHEIVTHLEAQNDTGALEELRSLLMTADLVKFAKYKASVSESDRALIEAVSYVRQTQLEVPDAAQLVERIVTVTDKEQRRYNLLIKFGLGCCILWCTIVTGYVIWQLWLNFG